MKTESKIQNEKTEATETETEKETEKETETETETETEIGRQCEEAQIEKQSKK